jgi:hypothetical protein
MKGSKMGKASDEQCRQNYYKLREFFNSIIEDHGRFEVVYACGIDVGMADAAVVRVTTYTYASYAVGFDAIANEIVILPVTLDLSSHGQPYYLKHSDIKKAKQSLMTKEITIHDNQLPKKYIQLNVQAQISKDPDNVVILVKQDEESRRFSEFFKARFKK